MKLLTRSMGIAFLGMSLVVPLAACDSKAEPGTAPVLVSRAAPVKCYDCGTISNIEPMTAKGEGTGLGMVLGAVAGAVVGHQIGDGKGQDAATVAGAVGGGFAGNEIEKRVKGTKYFQVTVTMDEGGATRTVDVGSMGGLVNGSHVKIVGSNLQALG